MMKTSLLLLVLLATTTNVLISSYTVSAAEATSEGESTDYEDDTAADDEEKIIVSLEIDLPAVDVNKQCEEWASKGECESNPDYMWKECAASCNATKKANVVVHDGEDAGIGAFRFAEEYETDNIELVLNVAQQLQSVLAENKDYTLPSDLLSCGKRPCSAGKLWKRAEEMRKEDMHDAAGADLIRALLKTGTEVDFQSKCKHWLKWALQSISKQRLREAREAEEEAKLEERRTQERAAIEEAMKRKAEYEADFVKFGTQLQQMINEEETTTTASVNADGTVDEATTSNQVINQVYQTFVQEGPQGGNYEECIQLIKKIPPAEKTIEILLIEARSHELLGNYQSALSASGKLVQKAANHQPWINDSPRMMAATLGANAAMQLGLSENALSFYQTVLKFDPEQDRARKQYRGLKKVIKLMDKAEEQIQKGYNKAASVHVDDCLSAMRGLDVDSPLFRSKIQLKQCTILSGMGQYEEALENCDTAVELRVGNDFVSSASKKEAHLVRAEALLLDMDYDEAVQDLRAAFDLTPDDADDKRELHHKLQQTMHQQEQWNGGTKDYRFNENTGYPDGMPPQRDHAKILQLPIDLEQRDKTVKCAWLRKQFKALVKKYHPDKYKGNKKRAARKFKEVKEAKEIISNQWDC